MGTAERCPTAVQLQATFINYRSMYIVFSLLALMIVVMTGVIPHTVPRTGKSMSQCSSSPSASWWAAICWRPW